MKEDLVLIIDGLNTFIRTWSVTPTMNSNGDHIGGCVGMLRSVKVLMRETDPTLVIICWDGTGGSQKRRGIFAEYKAGRKPRVNRQYDFDTPEQSQKNLSYQYQKTKEYFDTLGITQIEVDAVEADDIIAFLACHIFDGKKKCIVSTDKDFLQLVGPKTLVYSPTKKVYYTNSDVLKEYSFIPENFVIARAIMGAGDSSDGIVGIKGIGPMGLVKLFPFLTETPSTLDDVFKYAEEHKDENKKYESILGSRDLICNNVDLMQLKIPIISSQSVRAIQYALEKEESAEMSSSMLKLSFMKDGIQITDSDFFTVYNNYKMRAKARKSSEAKE